MTGAQLREKFLKYFEERGHARVAGSSLIPAGDPTLLFTNAGMVQFKNVFTGTEERRFPRAVTAQKCLRVSGKHNDLENVGHTARHHTFFEMLGNFSFGDYFKEDAIAFGWEFLSKVVGLPKDKLYITIYKDDDEAFEIWRKILGKHPNPIIRLGEKDNFWSMGDTGPCGPCSEIHIDQGEAFGCGSPDCAPGCDCDRFLELWNLVFMQFDRDENGNMTPLPRPSIDTGLGLERLAAVVQGVGSNWESDLFRPVIKKIEDMSGKKSVGHDRDSIAVRVIADHSRAAAFLIADGVLPSNEGRGYVLRRILRRALRYGKYIGFNRPFMYESALVVVADMAAAYPELESNSALIEKVIKNEEERFLETLARGLVLFEEETDNLRRKGESILPGEIVFKLYDTFGFPPDLTGDLAKESGFRIDQAGFDEQMNRQRKMARQSWESGQGETSPALRSLVESGINVEFTGYEKLEDSGIIKAIIKDGELRSQAEAGDHIELITDRSPFYAESGGQAGDRGHISANGSEMEVENTLKAARGLIIHKGTVKLGILRIGEEVKLRVGSELRLSTMANHSATHILQWALREVLGDHVKQSGSLVEPGRLRFDFTHFSPITEEELTKIENLVNEKIRENLEVSATTMPIDEAIKQGAMALFGEKYGDVVRMISMGSFSKELCGGTHTSRTGDIGLFKIIGEGGIAAGVRRMEALTATGALEYVRELEEEIKILADRLKGTRGDLAKKLDRLIEEKKTKDREIDALKKKLTQGHTTDLLDGVRDMNGVKVLARIVEDVSGPKDLREYADRVKDKLGSGIALLGAESDGKVLLIALVTKDLVGKFHAGNLVKKAAEAVGGSGGGRPDMAQAGGPNVDALDKALKTIESFVS